MCTSPPVILRRVFTKNSISGGVLLHPKEAVLPEKASLENKTLLFIGSVGIGELEVEGGSEPSALNLLATERFAGSKVEDVT